MLSTDKTVETRYKTNNANRSINDDAMTMQKE